MRMIGSTFSEDFEVAQITALRAINTNLLRIAAALGDPSAKFELDKFNSEAGPKADDSEAS